MVFIRLVAYFGDRSLSTSPQKNIGFKVRRIFSNLKLTNHTEVTIKNGEVYLTDVGALNVTMNGLTARSPKYQFFVKDWISKKNMLLDRD